MLWTLTSSLLMQSTFRTRLSFVLHQNFPDESVDDEKEPMFSMSYDPLEIPNQVTLERDLEDILMERALRFFDKNMVNMNEKCYLVGLEDKSLLSTLGNRDRAFTLEESLAELSELSGAAGLTVVGSTYQRVQSPSIEYYIGQGKTKEIARAMSKLKCTCVIFDVELTPSQQKNLELAFNQELNGKSGGAKSQQYVKVLDRTALILDIFAQHAKTKEGQLQVQLALLTYRLPRLTNMWSHLERQSASSKGKSNGGVGLRGPGEKQLESDKREMKNKISILNRAIDSVRRHRSMHRRRRRRLGVPVVALVGYTNSGKSTLLNSISSAGVFAADMLFATLDPTTRMVRMPGLKNPDVLLTDTVGFIQKLPTNLIAAFRATLEELSEADVLIHVTDVSNETWRKQEAAVLSELSNMGLSDKPVITIWNKIDAIPGKKEFLKFEAAKRAQTVALSAKTGEGIDSLIKTLETTLSSQMVPVECFLPYEAGSSLLDTLHRVSVLDEVKFMDREIFIKGRVPVFLRDQIRKMRIGSMEDGGEDEDDEDEDEEIDWIALAKGRHSARNAFLPTL
eukprot:gene25222-33747_t